VAVLATVLADTVLVTLLPVPTPFPVTFGVGAISLTSSRPVSSPDCLAVFLSIPLFRRPDFLRVVPLPLPRFHPAVLSHFGTRSVLSPLLLEAVLVVFSVRFTVGSFPLFVRIPVRFETALAVDLQPIFPLGIPVEL
jgi:hypothetical protein